MQTDKTFPGHGLVSLSIDGHIAVVRLERAEARNAISGALADELSLTLREVSSRPDIRVMVLAASGEKAFCVGADLKERASFELSDFHANRRQMRTMFASVRSVPQPTIAAVFGFALGGGFELALSCDLIVAAEGTKFGLPETRVGLLPAGGGTQLLTRAVGESRAKDLIFRGRLFDAAEGHAMGLVSQVVPPGDLDAAALEMAKDVCRSSPIAVRESKRSIERAMGPIEEGIEAENDSWKVVIESEDRQEGITAFNEKRDPQWQNR